MLYRKTGANFAGCDVLLAYTLGHVSLLGLLLLPLGRVTCWGWASAGRALQTGYVLWASRVFFASAWLHVVWRTLVMLAIYTLAMMFVSMLMIAGFFSARAI